MKHTKNSTSILKSVLNFGFTFIFAVIFCNSATFAQTFNETTSNFRKVVEKKLSKIKKTTKIDGNSEKFGLKLEDICPIDNDAVAKRVFIEYGAIFIAENNVRLPTKCIFNNDLEVKTYQNESKSKTLTFNNVSITLQEPAMNALLEAEAEAEAEGLKITPRGGSIAGARSYRNTEVLWNSRFLPALNYWVKKGKISREDAEEAGKLPIHEQIAKVLEWENKGFYFSKDFSKSILYSVAAPGASQHVFMLALDVVQFPNLKVRNILAEHGWFQTVKSDFPHFTYLGVKETELPQLGLKPFLIDGHKFWLTNY